MGLVVAGERSGCGKTTVTLALLAALMEMGQRVQSFKVGPDYIDPMFHQFVTGRPCYNLDPVLTSWTAVAECFARQTRTASAAIVEGVMGLFDGAADPPGHGSTAQVAKSLGLPVLLVLDCRSIAHSIAALVHGYRSLDPDLALAGVILNRVSSDRHLEILESALEPLDIPILGVFRREDDVSLPDRHLGLVPVAESPGLGAVVAKMAALGRGCFDWERLMPLLGVGLERPPSPGSPGAPGSPVRLAVARDAAFSFYYPENLEILESLGAECHFWSPLEDPELPADVGGLYFGGGFPEMFAAQLADNLSALGSVRRSIQAGVPTYAECGGLMYLAQSIVDFAAEDHGMAGILPTRAVMGQRLTLGYRYATARGATPLLARGTAVRGHEFHRSTLSVAPLQPLFDLGRGLGRDSVEGWYTPSLHASYVHLHWGATLQLPQRWLAHCRRWQQTMAAEVGRG